MSRHEFGQRSDHLARSSGPEPTLATARHHGWALNAGDGRRGYVPQQPVSLAISLRWYDPRVPKPPVISRCCQPCRDGADPIGGNEEIPARSFRSPAGAVTERVRVTEVER